MTKARNVLDLAAQGAVLQRHLEKDTYGSFELTEAIRPSINRAIVPREGYRLDSWRPDPSEQTMLVVVASVTRSKLWKVFMDLLDAQDGREGTVDVVLESSHDKMVDGHVDHCREEIDAVVLRSHLCEFENLLMRDGYTGIAVLGADSSAEVQFDEHKLCFVYARDVRPFTKVMKRHGVVRDDALRVLSEGEHLHLTEESFQDEFERMRRTFGAGES